MKAMILAAGRGERLRPLTDTLPKPLVTVGPYTLIEWHIVRLVAAGIRELVINLSYRGDQIRDHLGEGQAYGANIRYSAEGEPPLETGGGIFQALPLLGADPFLVVNGDIWTDFPYAQLQATGKLAHLVMIDNPEHHPQGDFYLDEGQINDRGQGRCLTYSGIGIYTRELFAACTPGRFPLAPLLRDAIRQGQVSGEYYPGEWLDIGTLERLEQLRRQVSEAQA